jgi:hypothetical protein
MFPSQLNKKAGPIGCLIHLVFVVAMVDMRGLDSSTVWIATIKGRITLRFTGKIKRSEVRAQLYSVRVQGIVSLMLFYLSQLVGLRELLLARSRLGVVPVQE